MNYNIFPPSKDGGTELKMVESKLERLYKCPICGDMFDKRSDCEWHIDEHNDYYPEIVEKQVYMCEVCKDKFNKRKQALECETCHEEGNDIQYRNYLYKLKMDKLNEAGNHPTQQKLKLLIKRN